MTLRKEVTADGGGTDLRPLFSVPQSWAWGQLAKALMHRKVFMKVDDTTSYRRVTVQLHGRGIVERDVVSGNQLKIKDQQVIRVHDFLVAEIDAKVGGLGVVPQELDGSIVSSHYFAFEIDQEVLLPTFLDAMIRSGFVTQQIRQFVRGSLNYAAIRPQHVLGVRFPYPPISVQRRIEERMSIVHQARMALREQVAAFDALPAALLRRAFSGEL